MGQNTRQIQKCGTPLNLWSVECQGHHQRQNRTKHKDDTLSLRREIKIHDPAENRTRAAGLEGRDSTDHATAMDTIFLFTSISAFSHKYRNKVQKFLQIVLHYLCNKTTNWNFETCLSTTFLKLWSADHLWASRSALVVLKKIQKKNSNSNEFRITL